MTWLPVLSPVITFLKFAFSPFKKAEKALGMSYTSPDITSLYGEEQFDTCWQLLTQPLLWGTWDLLQQIREWGELTRQNWSLVRVSAFQIRLVEFYRRTVSD